MSYDWTGIYLGANVGLGAGRNPSTVGFPGFFGTPFPPESFTQAPAGWLGGFQLGYNRQFGRVVLGLEADWQWAGQNETACVFVCGSEVTVTLSQRLRSFETLRGRVGFANDGVLFYATAGAAFASIGTNTSLVESFLLVNNAASFRHSQNGWVGGGGIEAAIAGNWTAKVEYLYADLGSISDSLVTANNVFAPHVTLVTSDLRDHILRVGVNYRFGSTGPTASYSGGGLPVKAAVRAPVYDWTGLYLGGNVGYSVGHDRTNLGQTAVPFPLMPELFTFSPAGWLGGGQLGFNWQPTRNLVVGGEADLQGTTQHDSVCLLSCETPFQSVSAQQKLPWFATFRGRAGYASGPVLFYLTGGLAVGEVRTDVQATNGSATTSASFDQTRAGWVFGGGIEAALAGNWSAKAEYLYMDLGRVSQTFLSPGPFTPTLTTSLASDVRDHVFRIGLNYRFGAASLVTKN
jgi:outer membrane immunogenic protein